ncbi:mannitol operon repressor, partial [Vibrio vulnificus]|uniref:MltR family transcriptional regulator n=1 Tax=Vibrio vulnificus TaxID=672 RepID=UPI0005014155
PLLQDSGTLGDVSVRLKLLLGLGVLSDHHYHDTEDIMNLKNKLSSDSTEYEFTDPQILEPSKKLHLVQKMGMVQLEVDDPDADIELSFYQLQLQRKQQIIRSGLSLAIFEICHALGKDSPF